jgi:hypothetical protein
MMLDIEGAEDRSVGGAKLLGRTLRFEALLLSFPTQDWQMRILGASVVSQSSGAVPIGTTELTYSGAIGKQAVSDNCLWMDALVLQQFPKQYQRCLLVPSFLHQHIEDFAFVIDGSPQVHSLSTDAHHHLIQAPAARGAGPCSSKIAGNIWPSFRVQQRMVS